jgi:hypothetical protein
MTHAPLLDVRVAFVLTTVFAWFVPTSGSAQFSPGARSVGMGGAGMIYSSGVDAVEWNPANLALGTGWGVSLGELGGALLLSGVTYDDLRAIMDAGGSGNAALVARIPQSGISVSSVTEGFTTSRAASAGNLPRPGSPLPSFGVAVGPFGLRVRSRVLAEATLSKEVIDLMVNGFDPALIQSYRVGDTGFRTTSFSEITAAYGTVLGERLAIGAALRYVQGHQLTEGKFFEPIIDLVNETVDVTGVAVEAPGGRGFGLDVGVALDLGGGLRVGASASSVVQNLEWSDDLIGHEATFRGCDDPFTPSCPNGDDFDLDLEELIDRFQARPLDPSAVSLPVFQTAQDLYREAYFPMAFHLGGGWRSGRTTVELVGTSVSPRGRQRSEWDERISLGVEQRLSFFVARAGAAKGSGGLQVLSAGLGFGVGPVVVDVAGGLMSGGFEFAEGLVTPEDVDYAGGQISVSLQLRTPGR